VSWNVRYTKSAAKAIRGLDPQVQSKVLAAIKILTEDPTRGKPLQLTLRGLRSWRTGDWRIIYRATRERLEILVIAVGHRRDVYERIREKLR
jgi:mRNA interferase RelE/StbE